MAIPFYALTTTGRWLAVAALMLSAAMLIQQRPVCAAESNERLSIQLLDNIQRYQDAHQRSRALRSRLQHLSIESEPAAADQPNLAQDRHEEVANLRGEYFSIREALFTTTYAHASTLVERRATRLPARALLETTLTLASAADLVLNADSVLRAMGRDEAVAALWNQPGRAPAMTADLASRVVAADLHFELQDLFLSGLPTLERHRLELNEAAVHQDSRLPAILPEGVDEGLSMMSDAYRTLRTRVASRNLVEDQTALRALVKRAKDERGAWRQELSAIRQRLTKDKGIVRGAVHVRLVGIKRSYLTLREELYPLAFKHVGIITREDVAYPPDLRLQAIALSSLAAATLYENAAVLQEMAAAIPGMKDLLNQADPSQGIPAHLWDHIEREYASPDHRHLFKAGLKFLDSHQPSAEHPHPFLTYVGEELSGMAAAQIRDEPLHQRYMRLLRHYESRTVATGLTGLEQSKVQTSKGFGNLVGAFEFRKGKLYDQPQWVEFVNERLQPGDILLEKTPFRVTDKFIPGHFGHVALYVGTVEQLKALGLWDHLSVIPYHAELARGRTIVEALRDGTQINSVPHFLNIDDLAILRPKPGSIPREDVLQAIQLAFTHIGKKYDFGFDTNTWDTIVCSELAFQTYVNVEWPFGKALGSYTISPDDVAIMAGPDHSAPFQLVSFIHDGQVVSDVSRGVRGEWYYRRLIEPKEPLQAGLLQFLPNPAQLLKPFRSKDDNP